MINLIELDTLPPLPEEKLLDAVTTEGAAAWPALCAALDPVLVAMASNQPIGRLRDHEDSPREIVTRVLVRLHKRDHEAIRADIADGYVSRESARTHYDLKELT